MESRQMVLAGVILGSLALLSLQTMAATQGSAHASRTDTVKAVTDTTCRAEPFIQTLGEVTTYYAQARLIVRYDDGTVEDTQVLYRGEVRNKTQWDEKHAKSIDACFQYLRRKR